MLPSLEARVHDPAWLLARQWQVGEFVGEDAGSPVQLEVWVATSTLDPMGAGAAPAPLDALAGAEPRGPMTLGEAAEAGEELVRALAEAGVGEPAIAALIAQFPLPAPGNAPADDEGTELMALLTGRLPDVRALEPRLRDLALGRPPALELTACGAEAAPLRAAAQAWLEWRDGLEQRPPSGDTWVPEHLEHRFTVGVRDAGGARLDLAADQWDGEALDWYDLDVRRSADPDEPEPRPEKPRGPAVPHVTGPRDELLGHGVDPKPDRKPEDQRPPPPTFAGVPSPLTYPGMPALRWWQFEDARVNFAQVTAAKDDLARLLVVEFATAYANDWYLLPLRLGVGALHRVSLCVVTTTFDETIPVGPAGGAAATDWRVFRPTERSSDAAPVAHDGLLLLPVLASPVLAEPVEDVLFLRDELANVAWAVERVVEGADGRPIDRHERAARTPGDLPGTAPAPAPSGGPLRYRLATDVPIHWYPLVPSADGTSTFQRLVLPRRDPSGAARDGAPLGHVLRPGEPLRIWQEEVPREGAEVRRRWVMARGSDGGLHVWSRREKRTGRGETSSGLRYDDALR